MEMICEKHNVEKNVEADQVGDHIPPKVEYFPYCMICYITGGIDVQLELIDLLGPRIGTAKGDKYYRAMRIIKMHNENLKEWKQKEIYRK